MNRRAFLAAIFGSAVASALPAVRANKTGWAAATAPLQPGDIITIASFYRENPIRYRVLSSYQSARDEFRSSTLWSTQVD